jgi:hypothetical protein
MRRRGVRLQRDELFVRLLRRARQLSARHEQHRVRRGRRGLRSLPTLPIVLLQPRVRRLLGKLLRVGVWREWMRRRDAGQMHESLRHVDRVQDVRGEALRLLRRVLRGVVWSLRRHQRPIDLHDLGRNVQVQHFLFGESVFVDRRRVLHRKRPLRL